MNRAHVYALTPYMLVGCLLWFAVFMSGVHSTIAGVLLAFTIPTGSRVDLQKFMTWSGDRVREARAAYVETDAGDAPEGLHVHRHPSSPVLLVRSYPRPRAWSICCTRGCTLPCCPCSR